MATIKQYRAQRVKDGKIVQGYAAVSCEGDRALILVPNVEGGLSFHIVEVDERTFEEVDDVQV